MPKAERMARMEVSGLVQNLGINDNPSPMFPSAG
jgi:hypothetical protein